jgi:glycosyltransferase involved in cell wall biosynthesis
MRLVFLTERYPPDLGGLAVSARRLCRGLVSLGHTVEVFALSADLPAGSAEMRLAEACLTVHRFGAFDDPELQFTEGLAYLEFVHRRQRFEVVWGHALGRAGFLATWLGRRLGLPVLLAVRGDDLEAQLHAPGDFARLEWCLRSATRVSAVTAGLAERVRVLTDRDAFPLPNGVDGGLFAPGPRPAGLLVRHSLAADELVLGFSGELRASKGMAFLFEAFRHVRGMCPCRLLVIGDVHPGDRGAFVRLSQEVPGGAADVVRTGRLPGPAEVAKYLRLCDVLLLPSLREGLPNSLLEAMASGVPVVASAVGGIPEVVRDGVNGLLVPRAQLHRLGRRVVEALDWPEEKRHAVTAAARATVLERFSPERERECLARFVAGVGG